MFRKAYNIFTKAAIVVLLVLGLWLVIGGSYKKDIGNLSDWISSLSTFGTLVVAYMAFKAAPKWIHQKQEEDAYSLVKELILDDLYAMNKHWDGVFRLVSSLKDNIDFISDDISYFLTIEECDFNLKKARDNNITPAFIKHKTSKIKKLNSNINPEILDAQNEMLKDYSNLYRRNVMLWSGAKKILLKNEPNPNYAKSISTLNNLIEKMEASITSMNHNYNKIESYSSDLADYFYKTRN